MPGVQLGLAAFKAAGTCVRIPLLETRIKKRVQEAAKKYWDSQPRLKTSLILRAFWHAACDSP